LPGNLQQNLGSPNELSSEPSAASAISLSIYRASTTARTKRSWLVEARVSQSSKHLNLIVIIGSVCRTGCRCEQVGLEVPVRVRRKKKVAIRPTSNLFLAGKPKSKALFNGTAHFLVRARVRLGE
jgi:hypothetical protein